MYSFNIYIIWRFKWCCLPPFFSRFSKHV